MYIGLAREDAGLRDKEETWGVMVPLHHGPMGLQMMSCHLSQSMDQNQIQQDR